MIAEIGDRSMNHVWRTLWYSKLLVGKYESRVQTEVRYYIGCKYIAVIEMSVNVICFTLSERKVEMMYVFYIH